MFGGELVKIFKCCGNYLCFLRYVETKKGMPMKCPFNDELGTVPNTDKELWEFINKWLRNPQVTETKEHKSIVYRLSCQLKF